MDEFHEIPPCDTHGYFYTSLGRSAYPPTTLASPNTEPDECAIFSVLQFGAIIPPYSPWRGIQRLLPGFQYYGTDLVRPIKLKCPDYIDTLDPVQQSYELEKIIDKVLIDKIGKKPEPVLLFSGGVDSGFIASRLSVLGYNDSLLLNYSFGKDDRESQLAEAMAKNLGLRFERISKKLPLYECLINPGNIYPQPFGDQSTVPTSALASAVVDRLEGKKRIIIDGTGADGAFGMFNKVKAFNRIMRIPSILRRSTSLLYTPFLWHRKNKIEYLSRILRRSIQMPLISAVIAQNPLAGFLYDIPTKHEVYNLFSNWIVGWAGKSLQKCMVASDMALTCANIFAQKAQSIFESAGHQVLFPFLQNEIVSIALRSIECWQMDEPKKPLKLSLARHVPHDMVYRPKSGFVDINGEVFFDQNFILYLRAAVDSKSPIRSILNKKQLIKTIDLLSKGVNLPFQTLNCIWAIAFLDRWYRTVK